MNRGIISPDKRIGFHSSSVRSTAPTASKVTSCTNRGLGAWASRSLRSTFGRLKTRRRRSQGALTSPKDSSLQRLPSEIGTTPEALVFQLDEQLNLARIQCLDRAAIRGKPGTLGSVIGADAQWIGVVGQVEGLHSHLQEQAFLPEVKGFHSSDIEIHKRWREEGVAPQTERASRNRIGRSPKDVRRIERIDWPATPYCEYRGHGNMFESLLEPRRSAFPFFYGQLE